jgi:hypothetical protein
MVYIDRERKKLLTAGVMTKELLGESSSISARNTALLSR